MHSSRTRRLSSVPACVPLESRCLLSTARDFAPTFTLIDSPGGAVAIVQGTNGPDLIAVVDDGVLVNGTFHPIDGPWQGVYADGNGGPDVLLKLSTAEHDVATILHGGDGRDLVYVVPNDGFQFDVAYGDGGRDVVLGDPSQDLLFTDEAEIFYPTLDFIGDIAFIYDDRQIASNVTASSDGETVTITDGVFEITTPATLTAIVYDLGPRDDTIQAISGPRVIAYGGDGDDTLMGRAIDELYGERGRDTIVIED
jgi:hypothetical protein